MSIEIRYDAYGSHKEEVPDPVIDYVPRYNPWAARAREIAAERRVMDETPSIDAYHEQSPWRVQALHRRAMGEIVIDS